MVGSVLISKEQIDYLRHKYPNWDYLPKEHKIFIVEKEYGLRCDND